MNSSRLSLFCDRALEAGWLLGVTITPVFFNVYSSRVFEPDKLTTLRALATIMAVLWLVRFLDERLRGEQSLRFTWRTPMVLPALLTMGIYLLSSSFSLVRATSILGSYQRLQGTYTLFGYLVIFFALVTSLRTRPQLSRLLTVLILNSLPISLYGIVQHNGLDPLPWAGDVQQRVASNMGNPIFVGAYLIMVVPLTAARLVESFRDIMARTEARTTDILRASGYIFIIAVQLLTIWYAQSRGPWLGIVTAGFLFPFLGLVMLLRQTANHEGVSRRRRWGDLAKGVAFGLGTLALAGGLAALVFAVLDGPIATYLGLGGALLVFGGVWLYCVVERKGWRWLWIGWGTVGLAIAVTMILINLPGPLQTQVRKITPLQRLTTITELQSGTGKVRGLIWQGTVDLISPHAPITYPDGSKDFLNFLRPLIGYGPESMYVAYNSFYPPELGHYESRTASPDRSHNETLDSLVITGVSGLAIYLFTFGSLFCWGFHWLGLMESRRHLGIYVGLVAVFAAAFLLIAWQVEGAYLFAVAIPLGLLVGTVVYLALQAFAVFFRGSTDEQAGSLHPHTLLLIGILAGVMAHYVEINFGIAIASTRTTFWALAGLLAVLGSMWVPGHSEVQTSASVQASGAEERGRRPTGSASRARRRSSSHTPAWLLPVVTLSLAALFLLGTLLFDFVNNPDRLTNPWTIFVNSLTMKYNPVPTRAFGALMIFVFTWVLFGVIGFSEYDREEVFAESPRAPFWRVVGTYAGTTVVGWLIVGLVIAGHLAWLPTIEVTTFEEVVGVAETLGGLLGRYYAFILLLLVAMAWVLSRVERPPRVTGNLPALLVGVALLLVGGYAVKRGCYDLIMADTLYKQGGTFANGTTANEKYIGISHFEKALEYAPNEDYYMLFLGKAYLELAQGLPDDTARDERTRVFAETERVLGNALRINPLNTDHSANLGRFYKSWAARISMDLSSGELSAADTTALTEQREDLLARSLQHYQTALTLSPNNAILWNELAQLYAIDLADDLRFQETISRSLQVDAGFDQTWMLLGDVRASKGDIDGATEAYLRSLEIRDNCTVRRVVGTLWAQQGKWQAASDFLAEAVTRPGCLRSTELWELYRVLSIALANQSRLPEALEAALAAQELAPQDQQATVQDLIGQLEQQMTPGGSGTVTPTSGTDTP